MADTASTGQTVAIHYTGRLEDGTVFDSSEGREPLRFTLGEGRVIKGFEDAVIGMEPGDTKTISIPPGEAYGERRDDLVIEVEKDRLPDELDPQVGQQLQLHQVSSQPVPVVVAAVSEETITVDANHPLAGRTLVFDLELVEVE